MTKQLKDLPADWIVLQRLAVATATVGFATFFVYALNRIVCYWPF